MNAYEKEYERIGFKNDTDPSIDEENLGKMEDFLQTLDARTVELSEAANTAEKDIVTLKQLLNSAQGDIDNVDIRVIKTEANIGALQKACETLENTKAQGIICTASGEVVEITDCSDSIISRFNLKGNTIQSQDIKGAMVSKVTVCNKNCLNNTATTQTVSGMTITVNSDKSISVNGMATEDVLIEVGTATLSKGDYIASGNVLNPLRPIEIRVDCYYADGGLRGFGTTSTETVLSLDEYAIVKYSIAISKNTTLTNAKFYPMISVKGGEYEPFRGNSITLAETYELNGLNGVHDDLSEGKRRFAKVVFDGSESWVTSGALVGRYGVVLDGKENGSCMCTIATNGSNGSTNLYECFINQNGDFYINTEFGAVDEWKAYLASAPIIVLYELAEPTDLVLSEVDQKAIAGLHGYKGITHVFADSEVPPIIEVDYVADTKIYIDNKIIELATAMVAGSEV